jgi:hypothetical protein
MSNQFNHLLSSSKISQATDLWVPSNTQIKPETSNQLSLSFQYRLSDNIVVSGEAYYKQMNHIVTYQEGASYLQSGSSWSDLVTFGSGKARGIGFTLEKKTGKTTGWLTYMYSHSSRKFADINQGDEFPFSYDRPHDLKVVVMHKFSSVFDISSSWVYHSGNRVTFGYIYNVGVLDFMPYLEGYDIYKIKLLYMRRNSYQLPAYQRLDVNINYHIHCKRIEHVISLGVYNVYNRKNIYSIELVENPINTNSTTVSYYIKKQSLFPIIPSLTYRFSF